MHHIIASYLFQHKTCPLPGLGTLSIQPGNAKTSFLNKTILAPIPVIVFDSRETEAAALLDYIAALNQTTIYQAIETLGQFSNHLKTAILSGRPALLPGVGNFSMASSGNIIFDQLPVAEIFVQPVKAERVIHPEREHAILVGDKETTNTEMTGYFNDIPVEKKRWWIWVIILGILGILALVMYLNGEGVLSRFGNAVPVK